MWKIFKMIFNNEKFIIQIPSTECSEKWSECEECEDEVNRKGHLTKLQEAVHVDNVKYIIIKSEQNKISPILKHV